MGAIVGYPLDTIKSRIQTQKHLPASVLPGQMPSSVVKIFTDTLRRDGFFSLYRGASSQIARSAIGGSFLYGLMAQFKWLFYTPSAGQGSTEAYPNLVLTTSASCTGMVEAMLYTPFEITMIRMQVRTNRRWYEKMYCLFSRRKRPTWAHHGNARIKFIINMECVVYVCSFIHGYSLLSLMRQCRACIEDLFPHVVVKSWATQRISSRTKWRKKSCTIKRSFGGN